MHFTLRGKCVLSDSRCAVYISILRNFGVSN